MHYNIILCSCLFTECRGGTRFISTRDTSLSGKNATKIPQVNSGPLNFCTRLCFGESCYGFSINYNTNSCLLYENFDHPLGVIGGSPGVDQYRRILYCSK